MSMNDSPEEHQKRFNGVQRECTIGLVAVGVAVTVFGVVCAAILPICYMFYAQQTSLGLLYVLTGLISYAAIGKTSNYTAKVGVAMTLHLLSWIMTCYITQVALNMMTQSFFRGRALIPSECPYSSSSSDTIIYYTLGSLSLFCAVIFLVLSGIVFVSFWRDPRPAPQMHMSYSQMIQPSPYQFQTTGGFSNGGFVHGPTAGLPMQAPAYSAAPSQNQSTRAPGPITNSQTGSMETTQTESTTNPGSVVK